jgi:hypothetical protein
MKSLFHSRSTIVHVPYYNRFVGQQWTQPCYQQTCFVQYLFAADDGHASMPGYTVSSIWFYCIGIITHQAVHEQLTSYGKIPYGEPSAASTSGLRQRRFISGVVQRMSSCSKPLSSLVEHILCYNAAALAFIAAIPSPFVRTIPAGNPVDNLMHEELNVINNTT